MAGALQYLYDMVTKQARACPYCIVGARLNVATLAFAVPEMRRAVHALREPEPEVAS